MEQILFGAKTNLPITDTEYTALVAGRATWKVSDLYKQIVSTSGKIKNLRVKVEAAPGVDESWVFTLLKGGVDTALTVTIAEGETSGADILHEVDVVAGDDISLKCVPTNGPPKNTQGWWSSMFVGSTAKESLILGVVDGMLSSADTKYYLPPGIEDGVASYLEAGGVCPTSGKIKNLYVELSGDPGIAPDAYSFTLQINGVASDLTTTIIAPFKTGNDTEHEVTVAAGDIITLKVVPLEGPSETPYARWGMTFVADIDGESIILAGTWNDLNPGATEYNSLTTNLRDDAINNWTDVEEDRYQIGQVCTLKKLYVRINAAAPGDGKSWTFTLRKPGNGQADGNLTVTITGAATITGNDVVNEDVIADDEYLDMECTPAGTPAGADAYWGLVSYRAPPGWSGIIAGVTNPAKIMGVDVANIQSVKGVVSA